MKPVRTDSFWPSYTDLMTSLFFVMLVLFILVFARQHQTITDLRRKLAIINAVEGTLRPLKSDSALFRYEAQYKRFKLAFEVRFMNDSFEIWIGELCWYGGAARPGGVAAQGCDRLVEETQGGG
jgi:hypothetical protein